MIYRLTQDDITKYWDVLKYGASQVSVGLNAEYLNNLLANLLSGNNQAWFAFTPDKKIKTMLITRIYKDDGNMPHLMISCAYGFSPATDTDKQEGMSDLIEFAKTQKCASVIAYTSNPMAGNAMLKMNMKETYKVYERRC